MGLGSGHTEETRELPGERDNARNNVRCTQPGKTKHGLDGQHQYVEASISVEATGNKVASCFDILLRHCCFDIVAGVDRT